MSLDMGQGTLSLSINDQNMVKDPSISYEPDSDSDNNYFEYAIMIISRNPQMSDRTSNCASIAGHSSHTRSPLTWFIIMKLFATQGVIFTGIRQPVFPALVVENVSATQHSKEVRLSLWMQTSQSVFAWVHSLAHSLSLIHSLTQSINQSLTSMLTYSLAS